MPNYTFKIKVTKFVEETKEGYVFANSKKTRRNQFIIPKSQTIQFEKTKIRNPYSGKNILWVQITITDWIWHKLNLEEKLIKWKFSSIVIVDNETHFGINWDYVIAKRKDEKHCYFCHGKLYGNTRTVDHLVARSILRACGYERGLPNNTVPCCFDCNQEKGSLNLEYYKEFVKRKISESGNPKYRIIMFNLNRSLVGK